MSRGFRPGPSRGYFGVALCMPKYDANVGGVLRASHCFGASWVTVTGERFRRSPADTPKTWRHTPVFWNQADPLAHLPYDCVPLAVELSDDAVDLASFTHPMRALYVFGPEDGSVPERIRERCKCTIKIPTLDCLNLAAAVNVTLYDRVAKGVRGMGFIALTSTRGSGDGDSHGN